MFHIAMLGGTFDPFHNGHAAIMQATMGTVRVDGAYVVPVHVPPHKNVNNVSPYHHRFAMAALALADEPNVVPIQLCESGYAVNEVKALLKMYPQQAIIFYVMGLDSFLDLHNWYEAEQLASLCHFVVARRPGYNDEKIKTAPFYDAKRVHLIDQIYLSISSTDIRNSIAKGQMLARQLVHPTVYDYIQKTRIYLPKSEAATI